MCGLKERASLLLSAELSSVFYELHNFKKFTHTHTHSTYARRDIFMEEGCQQEVGECVNMVKLRTHPCKNNKIHHFVKGVYALKLIGKTTVFFFFKCLLCAQRGFSTFQGTAVILHLALLKRREHRGRKPHGHSRGTCVLRFWSLLF